METVEAVSELGSQPGSGAVSTSAGVSGVRGAPGSAPRTTATAPHAGPATAAPAPRTTTPASHATTQHWPTAECSPAPEASAFPAALLGPEPLGPEPLDLVTVPARQGLEAVDILRRASAATGPGAAGSGPSAVGPVLHDGPCDTVGFLVPPGTADGWDMPGSACTQTLGRGVSFDIPGQAPEGGAAGAAHTDGAGENRTHADSSHAAGAHADSAHTAGVNGVLGGDGTEGSGWLLPPTDDTVPVTDPAALRRALGEAARLIEAADRCR
ncbi:hypothetical protein ACH4SP_21535 [Streptomyces sp. NPDC021093]|uniref:hypothetical protein n=1 Tax=Streptomyces sp. NPDC021093 TaxID=3365112 RepID=UPI00378E6606